MNTWNITSKLNVAFFISSSCCLLNLTLNSLILLVLSPLYFKSSHFRSFFDWMSLRSPWWFLDFFLLSTDAINYPSPLPPPICPLSFALISIQVTPSCPVPYSMTEFEYCCFDNTCIFSCLSSVLLLRVLLASYLKWKFFTISLAHVQCILKWSYFTKWSDIEDLAANQESIWCSDSLCFGCLYSQGP